MKTKTLCIGIAVALASLTATPQAQAWEIVVGCGYPMTTPSGPQPGILCEFSWPPSPGSQLTSSMNRWAAWSGRVVATWDARIYDAFNVPIFDMSDTPQPKLAWIRCADLSGVYLYSVFAYRYGISSLLRREWTMLQVYPASTNGFIAGNVPCG